MKPKDGTVVLTELCVEFGPDLGGGLHHLGNQRLRGVEGFHRSGGGELGRCKMVGPMTMMPIMMVIMVSIIQGGKSGGEARRAHQRESAGVAWPGRAVADTTDPP